MACPRITLKKVTPQVWQCLRGRAAAMGINLHPGDAGTAHHPRAEADYVWDEMTHTLLVTFTRIPSWISCNDVAARVRLAAATCGAG